MLAEGLRSHCLYNYAGYILSYVNIVYKPRNIPVQVKDECRLLIKTIVFIEHCNIKEIPVQGFYNTWKTVSLLYGPSTVIPVCHDTTYDSCGPSYAPHADRHPPGKPSNQAQHWLSCRLCYKKVVLLPTEPTIEENVSYCLSWLSVIVRALI
jgi:hypothetical protein